MPGIPSLRKSNIRACIAAARRQHADHLVSADSYLKLSTSPSLQFLAYASRTLRSLVIDTIREERVQLAGAAPFLGFAK